MNKNKCVIKENYQIGDFEDLLSNYKDKCKCEI